MGQWGNLRKVRQNIFALFSQPVSSFRSLVRELQRINMSKSYTLGRLERHVRFGYLVEQV